MLSTRNLFVERNLVVKRKNQKKSRFCFVVVAVSLAGAGQSLAHFTISPLCITTPQLSIIPPNTTMAIASQSTSMPSKPCGDDVPTTEAVQQNQMSAQSFGGDVSQSPPIPIVVPQKTVNPKFADTVVRTH